MDGVRPGTLDRTVKLDIDEGRARSVADAERMAGEYVLRIDAGADAGRQRDAPGGAPDRRQRRRTRIPRRGRGLPAGRRSGARALGGGRAAVRRRAPLRGRDRPTAQTRPARAADRGRGRRHARERRAARDLAGVVRRSDARSGPAPARDGRVPAGRRPCRRPRRLGGVPARARLRDRRPPRSGPLAVAAGPRLARRGGMGAALRVPAAPRLAPRPRPSRTGLRLDARPAALPGLRRNPVCAPGLRLRRTGEPEHRDAQRRGGGRAEENARRRRSPRAAGVRDGDRRARLRSRHAVRSRRPRHYPVRRRLGWPAAPAGRSRLRPRRRRGTGRAGGHLPRHPPALLPVGHRGGGRLARGVRPGRSARRPPRLPRAGPRTRGDDGSRRRRNRVRGDRSRGTLGRCRVRGMRGRGARRGRGPARSRRRSPLRSAGLVAAPSGQTANRLQRKGLREREPRDRQAGRCSSCAVPVRAARLRRGAGRSPACAARAPSSCARGRWPPARRCWPRPAGRSEQPRKRGPA